MEEQQAYDELCAYTLTRRGRDFIHQNVVDAFAVQNADDSTKPIAIAFGLFGLFLKIEAGFSGRQVQLAHMQLARRKRTWPAFELPGNRGSLTAMDVIAAAPGQDRDAMIDAWCRSVWDAFRVNRDRVVEELARHEIIPRA